MSAAVVAVLSLRADRPPATIQSSLLWKKLLCVGATVLTGIIVVLNVPSEQVELTDWQWTFLMLSYLSSIGVTIAGIILGVSGYVRRRHSSTPMH